MKAKPAAVVAILCALAVPMAACGSSSSGGSSSSSSSSSSGSSAGGSTTSAGGTASGGTITVRNTAPTTIEPTTPLKAKPPVKTVAWLTSNLPSITILDPGFAAAAKALGWKEKVYSYTTGTPGTAMQSAIDGGANYIMLTGQPPVLYKPQIQEAIAKHIPILLCDDPDSPQPKVNGIYFVCGGRDMISGQMKDLAGVITNTSGGKAHVVMVNVTDFPILAYEQQVLGSMLASDCPKCTFKVLPITATALGAGSVPGQVVSYLKSNPDTNYVDFAFSGVDTGVPQAVAAGGVSGIKFVGADALQAQLKDIASGKQLAWTVEAQGYTGWYMTDVAARLALGQPLDPVEHTTNMSSWIADSPQTAKQLLTLPGGYWDGPANFQSQFQKLWGVG
jgi:ribose transport system substrate-binding protein